MHSAVSGALLSYSCAHTLGKILILSGRSKTYVWSFGIGKQEERSLLRVMTWYNCYVCNCICYLYVHVPLIITVAHDTEIYCSWNLVVNCNGCQSTCLTNNVFFLFQ